MDAKRILFKISKYYQHYDVRRYYEIQEDLGVSKATFQRFINENRSVSIEMFIAILADLGIKFDKLLKVLLDQKVSDASFNFQILTDIIYLYGKLSPYNKQGLLLHIAGKMQNNSEPRTVAAVKRIRRYSEKLMR